MHSFLLLGVPLAPISGAQAQQSPKSVQVSTAVQDATKFDPDPQDYPRIPLIEPAWLEAAPGCKVFVSDYTEGVTVKWQGASKDGKGHGSGQLTRYDDAGKPMSITEGTLQQGLWQGLVHIGVGDVSLDVHMQDGYMEGPVQIHTTTGIFFQGQMTANVICGPGRRVYPDGTTEEGFFLDNALLRGKIKDADGQVIYWEDDEEVEALSPETAYNPALGVPLVEYFDNGCQLCDPAEAEYYRVLTYKAPFRPQGLVREYYMDGTLQSEFTAPYLDSRNPSHIYYDGLMKQYNHHGILIRELTYALGTRRGMSTDYWANGRKKRQVVYLRTGIAHGPFRCWSEAGYLLVDAAYEQGELKYGFRRGYDEAGRYNLDHRVNFQQDLANWQRQDGDGLSEVDDSYLLTITPTEGAPVLRFAPVKVSFIGQERDYLVRCLMNLTQEGRYGLLLGVQDKDNYISFELNAAGEARVCRMEGGRIEELKPWTSFPAAAPDQEQYALKVVCQEGQWYFLCQGQELFVLPAEPLKAPCFGVLAQETVDVANLEIREWMGVENTYPAPFPAAAPLQPLPIPKWLQAGPGCEVFEPCFGPGVTLKWEGPVQEGKAHGQGRLTRYVDGQQDYLFEGSCQQGIPTGKGKRTDANGRVLTGDFADGLPNGQHYVVWPNSTEYHGQLLGGRIHGEGRYVFSDKAVLQGFIANHKLYTGQLTTPDGECTYYDRGEEVAQLPVAKREPYTPVLGVPLVEYRDSLGRRCAKEQAMYYREVTYKAPFIPQGTVRDFYMDGTPYAAFQALYLDPDDIASALYEGERKQYHANGQLHSQSFYDRGYLHGAYKTYTMDGELLSEQYWKQSEKHGLFRTWELGRLHSQVSYIDGIEIDRWLMDYQEDGSVQRQWHYGGVWDISGWGAVGVFSVDEQQEPQQVCLQGRVVRPSWAWRNIPLSQQQYVISATMGLEELHEDMPYGLLLGYLDADNHCELLVRHQGKGGEVAFFRTRNGVRRMLMPWKQVPLQAQSHLAFSCKEGQMEVRIDGGAPIALPLTQLAGQKFGACLYGDNVLQLEEFGVLEYVTGQDGQ